MCFKISTSLLFSQYFAGREVYTCTINNIVLGIFWTRANGVFWFIFDLMLFKILAPLINKLIEHKVMFYIIIAVIYVAIFFFGNKSELLYRNDAVIYYLLGAYIGKRKPNMFFNSDKRCAYIICYIFSTLIIFFNYKEIINANAVIISLVLIIASISFWNMANYFSNLHKFLGIGGHYTFLFYALNNNLAACVGKLIYLSLPKNTHLAIGVYFMTVILSIIIIKLIGFIWSKYLPKSYSIVTGGRI